MSEVFAWSWQGERIEVGYDGRGPDGAPPVLLLPALSTVSTRAEMVPLARRLEASHRSIVVDWPGFGAGARPALDYTPDALRGFLAAFVDHLRHRFDVDRLAVIAAGHAAGYALDLEAGRPGTFAQLVLIAPTWRGPLPTVMGGRRPIQARIRKLVQAPLAGELIYRLNVSRPVVRRMYRGHVFADADRMVTPAFLTDKMAVAHRPNARYASACFVTGALDPMPDRDAFLDAARRVRAPILMLYGADTPRRSQAEMAALAELSNVEAERLDRGALGLHEEFPDALAPPIEAFLGRAAAATDAAPSASTAAS